jgi:hypothetical protein
MGEFIPIIAIIMGCTIPMVAIFSKHKERVAAMDRGIILDDRGRPIGAANSNAAIEAEMKELRERVKVLERIVTDGGYNLANEIEALRDARTESDKGTGVPLNVSSREKV